MYKDKDIRPVLIKSLRKCESDPDYIIVEEFGLCQGDVRVDVAVINGAMNGYEIKSEKDTLKRLPKQQKIYGKIFDSVTLLTTKKHLKKAMNVIPKWWGVCDVIMENETLYIQEVRKSETNTGIDPDYLVQLLWRDEALEILKERNLHKGILSKPRDVLWSKLTNNLTIEELKTEIRTRIKFRNNWRSGPRHKSSDGCCPL